VSAHDRIPVYVPSLGGNERRYVDQCLDSTWISSKGEFVERFESSFRDFIGARHATSVANGTVALHLAMAACGLGLGDEVIVPTFTYIASVNTIVQTGATPVFVDSDAATWQVDPAAIGKAITSRTKAVLVVHLYGHPCSMDEIVELCEKRGLLLIEDCAEAFGTLYHGRHVGTFGQVSTFSFYGNKTITTGEGGMVVCREATLHKKCAKLKNQGVSETVEYWHDEIAYNYRMTNVCAAIGLAQLERAPQIIECKRQVASWYAKALEGLPVELHREVGNVVHSYWMNSILVADPARRDPLREHLARAGIETRPTFYPAHLMPMYRLPHPHFPVAESLGARGINLPSSPLLQAAQIERIAEAISRFFST